MIKDEEEFEDTQERGQNEFQSKLCQVVKLLNLNLQKGSFTPLTPSLVQFICWSGSEQDIH